jgi:hypothetical protein
MSNELDKRIAVATTSDVTGIDLAAITALIGEVENAILDAEQNAVAVRKSAN